MTSMIISETTLAPLTSRSFIDQMATFFANGGPTIVQALIYIALGFLIIRVLSVLLSRILGLTKLPKALVKVTVRLLDAGLWLLFVIALMQNLGLSNVALAISGAFAVFALGISNGLTATVSDTISGLNLARDRHFRIGDRVIAGDRKTEGVIIDLDMRKARLQSKDGQIHVIPNGLVDKNEFVLVERAGQTERPKPRRVIQRPAVRTRATKTSQG